MPSPTVFDAALVRRRLARAAGCPADFLLRRTIEDMLDRLAVVQRRFTRVADVLTPTPALAQALQARDSAAHVVRLAPIAAALGGSQGAVGDFDALPFAAETFDLAVSALALQYVDDLPGALLQIRRALVPDGLFLGAVVGGRTLVELRAVLTEAEIAISGGASPRVAPFADVRDLGALMQRAGFALPVVDSETIVVRYDHLFALMADLRAMGAANALVARSRHASRRLMFQHAAALYASRHADPDGRIRATFEVISLSGWAPHASQQPPARRGSGKVSLAAILGDQSGNLGRS